MQDGSYEDWRVLTFYGSIHMATVAAKDEQDALEIAGRSTYSAVIQRREVGPWAPR